MAIERIAYYEYKLDKEVTKRWLDEHDFNYDKIMSSRDCVAYSVRFPVYKYEGLTVLDGVITIWPDDGNRIKVDCFEHNTRNHFARFYYWEYGKDDRYMEIINNRVNAKLRELRIEVIEPEIKDGHKENTN